MVTQIISSSSSSSSNSSNSSSSNIINIIIIIIIITITIIIIIIIVTTITTITINTIANTMHMTNSCPALLAGVLSPRTDPFLNLLTLFARTDRRCIHRSFKTNKRRRCRATVCRSPCTGQARQTQQQPGLLICHGRHRCHGAATEIKRPGGLTGYSRLCRCTEDKIHRCRLVPVCLLCRQASTSRPVCTTRQYDITSKVNVSDFESKRSNFVCMGRKSGSFFEVART